MSRAAASCLLCVFLPNCLSVCVSVSRLKPPPPPAHSRSLVTDRSLGATTDRFGAHTQSARVSRPLPRACRREHSPGSRGRCHPSPAHACDRLPVARGRRRLDVLAPEPGWRLPAVSRHASSTAAGGAWAGGCSRECGKRPIRWARARAPGSCSLPLSPPPAVPTPTPLEAGATAPASTRAPQRHHPHQAR